MCSATSLQPVDERAQPRRIVDVGRPVQRQHGVAAVRQPQRRLDLGGHGAVARWASRVSIITLPTTKIARSRTPSRRRLTAPSAAGCQQDRRQPIGDEAVDLLGHRQVEASAAPLRRARRAYPSSPRRAPPPASSSRRRPRPPGPDALSATPPRSRTITAAVCVGVRSAAHAEVPVRARQTELLEEDARHRVVVVLARVDESLFDVGMGPQGRDQRGDLRRNSAWCRRHGIPAAFGGHAIRPRRCSARQNAVLRPSANRRARSLAESHPAALAAGEADGDVEAAGVGRADQHWDRSATSGCCRRRRRACRRRRAPAAAAPAPRALYLVCPPWASTTSSAIVDSPFLGVTFIA